MPKAAIGFEVSFDQTSLETTIALPPFHHIVEEVLTLYGGNGDHKRFAVDFHRNLLDLVLVEVILVLSTESNHSEFGDVIDIEATDMVGGKSHRLEESCLYFILRSLRSHVVQDFLGELNIHGRTQNIEIVEIVYDSQQEEDAGAGQCPLYIIFLEGLMQVLKELQAFGEIGFVGQGTDVGTLLLKILFHSHVFLPSFLIRLARDRPAKSCKNSGLKRKIPSNSC